MFAKVSHIFRYFYCRKIKRKLAKKESTYLRTFVTRIIIVHLIINTYKDLRLLASFRITFIQSTISLCCRRSSVANMKLFGEIAYFVSYLISLLRVRKFLSILAV